MDSVCVYEQNTVIHELTQAIQMAKQLRVQLDSAEAREFLIQKILSSYENALFILKSCDSTGKLPTASLVKSSISLGSGEFEFDQQFINQQGQNVVSKKRKGTTTWEDQVEVTNKRKHTCNYGTQLAKTPPPPPSPEKQELKPAHHNQLSSSHYDEMLSNLRVNLSVNTVAATDPLDSFPSSPFGFMEEYQQLNFLDHFDNELLQGYSPPIISPETSESNYFTEWSNSPTLDFSADHIDVYSRFNNSFY